MAKYKTDVCFHIYVIEDVEANSDEQAKRIAWDRAMLIIDSVIQDASLPDGVSLLKGLGITINVSK